MPRIIQIPLIIINISFNFFLVHSAQAQNNISYELKNHIVYYSIFNSTLISAQIASNYSLIRAKNQAYLNIAIIKKTGGYGIAPQKITAVYRNLIQQKTTLDFTEIMEENTNYYLAPIRFNNEDIIHLDIKVIPEKGAEESTFTMTKKLYFN